jgi:Zn-dependent protease
MSPLTTLILERVAAWVPLALSLTVHEWAHARAAAGLGDPTAQSQGRLSLDPLVHLDPVGSVLLPLLGLPVGWARPVPVNPANFRGGGDGRLGMMWTAAAGPLSNVALALGAALALAAGLDGQPGALCAHLVVLNLSLAFFNLLPLPPLDGSRIVDFFCPPRLRPTWDWLSAQTGVGILLLVALSLLVDLGAPVRATSALLLGWAAD